MTEEGEFIWKQGIVLHADSVQVRQPAFVKTVGNLWSNKLIGRRQINNK